MLNKLRNFSKGKLAGVLVGIIIIPFVFWGMGSVFSGGSTNSIAKINNHNVSTQDFADFINNSKISPESIKENINNNVLEELLAQLVSTSLIDIEIGELEVFISDKALAKKIKKQKSFQDENNNFSRTKYEKFLLENNMHSVKFEKRIRDNELKKKLFTYIGGGIKSPFFLINKKYNEQSKKVDVDYIDLNSIYINKNKISIDDLKKHINENEEKFLVEKVDISLIKITPENLSGETEFTNNFFSKIDEIEDLISNKSSINEISKKYNLEVKIINEYYPGKDKDELLNEIYKKRNKKVLEIVDKNDFFLLYEIKNLKKILPSLENKEFLTMVRNDLFERNKYNIHTDLMKKIQKKKFTNEDFYKLSEGMTNNLQINSIKDTSKFTRDSVNLLYSMNINNFSLISDKKNNIYLVKIKNIYENNLSKNSEEIKTFANQSNAKIRDDLYNSYDYLLNEKYKIKINQKTLDRMKNYFR
jgi:peptidyl-prolyl cis-trans isomerase D